MVKNPAVFLLGLLLFGINLNKIEAQPLFAIHEIQGDGSSSPLTGQQVSLQGNIVTARSNNFFVIQAPESAYDNNELTSEGILVSDAFFGQPGAIVDVTGTVYEENGQTVIGAPGLSIQNTGQSAALPPAIVLTESFPSPTHALVHDLERVEGMRVVFEAIANGPSTTNENVPLRISQDRVFREPGIEAPGIPGLPEWDGNPELFWLDPNGLTAPNNRFIQAGSLVNATGIMTEAEPGFWLVLAEEFTVTPGPLPLPVRNKTAQEFTVGSLNAFFLLEEEENIEPRYQKVARYINEQMKQPDILALQEVGNLAALNNLAFFIEQQNPEARYDAYLLPGDQGLKLGYLVKENFTDVEVTQLGAEEVFTFSGGLLHDRPPLLLQIELPTVPAVSLQVLNLHLRSLIGIEGSNAAFVRNKRHQQAISIAQMVDELQENGNLVVLGDFNAFPFSDGYVDVFSQIAGLPSLGAVYPVVPIVAPQLQNPLSTIPPEEQYSYVYGGNAQALDHCLTSGLTGLTATGLEYARGNADLPSAYELSVSNAWSASDHDGLVLYLQSDFPISSREEKREKPGILLETANPISPGAPFRIKSSRALRIVTLYPLTGQPLKTWKAKGLQHTGQWPELPAGLYWLEVIDAAGNSRGFQIMSP